MQIKVSPDDLVASDKSTEDPITIALRHQFNNPRISISRNFIRVAKKRVVKGASKYVLIPLPKAAKQHLLTCSSYGVHGVSFTIADKYVKKLKG